jgi:ribonuclease-3
MEELEHRIGYTFRNKDLLRQALTHSSFLNEQKLNKTKDYERIEFLGDAILEMVSSEFLYHRYPEMPEGQLSKLRASMVCEKALAFCARDLELGQYLILGKGEDATGGRERESIIADVMESVTGAIFLDSGLEEAKKFIFEFILNDLENKQLFVDSKSRLQELVQGKYHTEVHYELIGQSGPDHDKTFHVNVLMGDRVLGTGSGRNKKLAEQQAAYEALLALKG